MKNTNNKFPTSIQSQINQVSQEKSLETEMEDPNEW